MASKEVKHDKYCWRCCNKKTSLKCTQCIRAFHKKCAPINGRDVSKDENWLCPVCEVLKATQNDDNGIDLKVLPVLIDKIWNDKSFDALKSPLENSIDADITLIPSIVHPVNLSQIKRKTHYYSSFNEFYVDVCWIVHNAIILFAESHANTKASRSLLQCIVEDIQSARACFECYLNATKHPDDWFSMACDEPHLIIWIRQKTGSNYCPAKLISVSGQVAKVQLFGDHSFVDVAASNCLLYSESSPSRIPKLSDAYNEAIKEANTYIGNLTKKFGSFRFAESKTAFNPALLEYYIAQLIPGSVEYRRNRNVTVAVDLCSDDSSAVITEADTTCHDDSEQFTGANPTSYESDVHNFSYEPVMDFQYDFSWDQRAANDVIVIE